ncbi:MAG: M28 family peptidase [Sphingomonadales bacterium]
MKKKLLLGTALLLGLAACDQTPPATGIDSITAEDLHAKIKILASDEFQGRAPSSPGEEITVAYIRDEFIKYGLEPGNNGSWYQDVPLVDITADANQTLTFSGGEGEDISLTYMDDYVALTRRVVEDINIADSEMVFVGYGIVAPEYGWDDYAGVDMTGKTAVMLVNDPGYATQNDDMFTGNAMTIYGRWTYKYEEAAKQGADAVIIIHETGAAGYPWSVVRGGWSGQNFYLESADGNMSRTKSEGWITGETAEALFNKAGLDLGALSQAAQEQGFKPVLMNTTASVSFSNAVNHSLSKNVIGLVPGSENPDEVFIYMAHWDHFGIGEADETGDNIYNGALDNASGTAALLEVAEAFATLPVKPKRSVLFVAVTAEEQGLLGSQHYSENPSFPLNKTIGGLNMDGLNLIGPTNDIVVTGFGMSELDGNLKAAADGQGRVLAPDPDVEKGYYFRSDHFNLAKKGVPMIYPGGGIDHVERGPEYGQAQADDYVANRYHKPSDEYDPTWDLTGGELDTKLYYLVGAEVAGGDTWPNWNIGTAFRAIRDESLQKEVMVEKIGLKLAMKLDAKADDVWAIIGNFGDLDWHPAVASTAVEGEGLEAVRTLTLVDGAVIVETLDEVSEMSYSYSITSSPLPVQIYSATLKVVDEGDGVMVELSSNFEPKTGASAEEAQAVVSGIYKAGFDAIQEAFSK